MDNIQLIGLLLAIVALWIIFAAVFNYLYAFDRRKFGTAIGDWVYAGCIFRWCRVSTDNAFHKAVHYPILEPTNEGGKQFLGKWVICKMSRGFTRLDRIGLHKAGECLWCIYMTRAEYDHKFRRKRR